MARQWLRRCSVLVGDDGGTGIDLSALKCTFTVLKGTRETTNAADVTIFNPAPLTVRRIADEFTRLVLIAGYEGNFHRIFNGWIRWRRFGRASQTDTFIQLQAGDGDKELNFSVVSHTLAAGYTQEEVKDALVEAMELTLGYSGPHQEEGAPRGKVLFGMARDRMRDHARTNRMTYSVQDGELQLVSELAYLPGEVIELSPETGLIGLPRLTFQGVEARVLLNPAIRIDRLVYIDQKRIQDIALSPVLNYGGRDLTYRPPNDASGVYRVIFVRHVGDTRGNDWYTDLVAVSVDPSLPIPVGAIGMGVPSED